MFVLYTRSKRASYALYDGKRASDLRPAAEEVQQCSFQVCSPAHGIVRDLGTCTQSVGFDTP